jgi:hypothetical protein
MRNPWLAKNPWLSLWMSGANTAFGTWRAHATSAANAAHAHAQRRVARAASEGLDQMLGAWLPAPPAATARKRRRTRTRR